MSHAPIHVVPAHGRWAVSIEGESQFRSEHRIQLVASMYARELAKARQADLVIHARDGTIRQVSTFGPRGAPRWVPGEGSE